MSERIAVIGAGSWGTALAKLLAEQRNDVLMWAYEADVADGINRTARNPLYLPDIILPRSLKATNDPVEAIRGRSIVVSTVPSTHLREVWKGLATALDPNAVLVSCTKGIEISSLKLMSQVLAECLPGHSPKLKTVLSGPSFAPEVAAGKHTWVVIAGIDADVCMRTQDLFTTTTFHPFFSSSHESSVESVEVGGAVKNVIAIATGLADGMDLGQNARAANITRGLYEMMKIGSIFGVNPVTFTGLAGIGDLALTCTGGFSRNYALGLALGRNQSLDDLLDGMRMFVEGIPTSEAVHRLAKRHSLNVPICEAVYRILHKGLSPADAVDLLCNIPLKEELGALLKTSDRSGSNSNP